jgi:hypothetical protein
MRLRVNEEAEASQLADHTVNAKSRPRERHWSVNRDQIGKAEVLVGVDPVDREKYEAKAEKHAPDQRAKEE